MGVLFAGSQAGVSVCAEERVSVMHPSDLATLLRDPGQVGQSVIQLRALLPLCNVSSLAALAPHLLAPETLASLSDVRSAWPLMYLLARDGWGRPYMHDLPSRVSA